MQRMQIVFFFCLVLISCLHSCNQKDPNSTKGLITVEDGIGREVKIPIKIERVISLSPSTTECLMSFCTDDLVVGVTQNCDYPELVRSKEVVITYPNLDIEKITKLSPDLVITQTGMTTKSDLRVLEQLGIPVFVTDFNSAEDILEGLITLGEILGFRSESQVISEKLNEGLGVILDSLDIVDSISALVLVSTDPIYVYGNGTLMDDELKKLGFNNAVQKMSHKKYPQLTREMLLRLNPDLVIYSELDPIDSVFLNKYPEFKLTQAYKNQNIFALKGNHHSRPGPRFIQTIQQLKAFVGLAKK